MIDSWNIDTRNADCMFLYHKKVTYVNYRFHGLLHILIRLNESQKPDLCLH